MFWFDEMRVWNGFYILSTISDKEYIQALNIFVSNFDHTLFQIFSIILQIVRYYTSKLFIDQEIQPYMLMDSNIGLSICVTILSLSFIVSIIVLNKILVYLKACGDLRIIIISCFALSCSILPYSRHLLPYDLATTIYLLSILLIFKKKYFVSGITCMFSILTYNGYSATFIATILFCTFFILVNEDKYCKVLLIYGVGLSTVLLIIQSVASLTNVNYIEGLLNWAVYAQNNQQGDFGKGYILFFEYLWQTESLFVILMLVPCIFIKSLFNYLKTRNVMFFGTFFVLIIYGLLVIKSDISKSAVMYSRTINQIIPFLCIFVGCGIFYIHSKLLDKRKKIYLIPLALAIYTCNVYPIINMEFPKDISLKNLISPENTLFINEYLTNVNVTINNANKRIYITNCSQIYPGIKNYNKMNFNEILWSKRHPFFYKPYQYMHFNYNERRILSENPPMICYGY